MDPKQRRDQVGSCGSSWRSDEAGGSLYFYDDVTIRYAYDGPEDEYGPGVVHCMLDVEMPRAREEEGESVVLLRQPRR